MIFSFFIKLTFKLRAHEERDSVTGNRVTVNKMSLALKLGFHLAKYLAYAVDHLSFSSLAINLLSCLAMNCLSSACISSYINNIYMLSINVKDLL